VAKRRLIHRIQEEYQEKYKDIPVEQEERLEYIVNSKKYRGDLIADIAKARKKLSKIKWKTYSFIMDMEPAATSRPRHTFTGRVYVPGASERADLFENFVLPTLIDPPFITTPCLADIKFYERTPSSFNMIRRILAEEKRIPNVTVRDIDNMLKAVLDFIQHGMLENDNKVYISNLEKWYSIRPRIEITIKYMDIDPYTIV
jgi:Holliday junction resolvase RusA-like endonuclease